MKPTITRGLGFGAYRAIPAVNWSTLKAMADSPAHYAARLANPIADTPRLAMGRAVHTAVLEPDRFPLEYVLWDGGRRAGKEWVAFTEANTDRTILKLDEYETCLAVRDAVRGNAMCAEMLCGDSEVTVEWTDADTGIACKGRIDHINEHGIVDLKTTSTVDERLFSQLSARMLYHSQLAFYNASVALPLNPRIIAVEIDPPYDVAVFEVGDWLMDRGTAQVAELLEKLAECQAYDRWPGRYPDMRELPVPRWLDLDDNDLTGLGLTIGGDPA